MSYARPKGTFDILPYAPKADDLWKTSPLWQHVTTLCKELAHLYGFSEVATPIFESTWLFTRAAGDDSDVSKEMYQFSDKGGRDLSLRPEGTAGVVRAFIENGLHQLGSSHKLFYLGPFFRYDRPQAGRYRQFHQFGAEAFGVSSPERDFEVIMMLYKLYTKLGLKDLNLLINCLGDESARAEYVTKLKNFLTPHLDQLGADSKRRLSANPLRILDTKDPKELALLEKAPSILECLSKESLTQFETLVSYLKEQGLPVTVTPRLVRGLDYYNETVFEVTAGAKGAQNALGGGGRYDHLMKKYGGPDLPAVGFAVGIERIILAMLDQKVRLPESRKPVAHIIVMEEKAKKAVSMNLESVRAEGIAADMVCVKKIQKGLTEANKRGASFALIIGSNEWEKGQFQLKSMKSGKLSEHPLTQMAQILKEQSKTYET